MRLWVPEGNPKSLSRVVLRGYTANQSNEALLKKFMTTKFPSGLVLMELAEELEARNCELQLQWVRRDLNQRADDLTNEKVDHFSPDFRLPGWQGAPLASLGQAARTRWELLQRSEEEEGS